MSDEDDTKALKIMRICAGHTLLVNLPDAIP